MDNSKQATIAATILELEKKGMPVTNRAVLKLVGGSMTDVCEAVRTHRIGVQLTEAARAEMPPELAQMLDGIIGQLWAVVKEESGKRIEVVQRGADVAAAEFDTSMAELSGYIEELERDKTSLERDLYELRCLSDALEAEASKSRTELELQQLRNSDLRQELRDARDRELALSVQVSTKHRDEVVSLPTQLSLLDQAQDGAPVSSTVIGKSTVRSHNDM